MAAATSLSPSSAAAASPGAGTAPASAGRIAVIDLSPLFASSAATAGRPPVLADAGDQAVRDLASRVRAACETAGCFYLAGIRALLPEGSVASLDAAARAFFSLPLEKKLACRTKGNPFGRGYLPYETENAGAFMGRAGFPNDPVEKFGVGPVDPCPDPELLLAHPAAAEWWEPNVWPEEPPDFRRAASDYHRAMNRVANVLMALFSVALDMDPDFVQRHFERGPHSLKINYYPPVPTPKAKDVQTRLGEHTDASPFTLLTMDDTKNSLMVRTRDNAWTFVNRIPGTVFVNLGETMAWWTNYRWVATPHKVVWPEETAKDRVSIAYFAVPACDAKLACVPSCLAEGEEPPHPPMTAQEFVAGKLRAMADRLQSPAAA